MDLSLYTLLVVFANLISYCRALYTNSTALILAQDESNANEASYLLNSYGIRYETYLIPKEGRDLPALSNSAGGHYGLLVVHSELAYDGTASGFSTVLNQGQWDALYEYQRAYGVRMVHIDVVPKPAYGAQLVGIGCCTPPEEQTISVVPEVQQARFPTAGIRYVDSCPLSETRLTFHLDNMK